MISHSWALRSDGWMMNVQWETNRIDPKLERMLSLKLKPKFTARRGTEWDHG